MYSVVDEMVEHGKLVRGRLLRGGIDAPGPP